MAPAHQPAAHQASAGNPNKTLAWVLVLLGAIPLTIGVIKLYVTGFYPSELPLFGGLALGGIGIMALGRWIYGRAGKPPANTPYLPQGHGGGGAAPHPASPVAPTQAAAPVAALPIEPAAAASNAVDPAVDADYHRLQAPDLTAVELQEVAARSPQLRPQIAAHALAYPALLDWLAALGDPAVDAALAVRFGQVAESVASAATVAAAPVVAAAPTPAPTVMPSFAAPEPTATPVMPAAVSNAAYAQPNYQAPGKDRRPQTATTPSTPAARPSKSRSWLIPVAASVAALAVAGAAAAVVLPRLNANNSAATDTYDGPPQSGQSGQSDGGGASQASADQPAATFQDGAAVAWEARASDLMNDPRAVFAWPQVWDDYINELWLGPIDLGDEWLVLISTQDSGVLGAVAVDKFTGQKRWEIQSATLTNCGVVTPGVVACLESDGPRARVSFRDSTSGSVTATHDLDYGAGSLAARDGFAAVTGSPGADGINTTIFDENGAVLGEAAVPLSINDYPNHLEIAGDLVIVSDYYGDNWFAVRPNGKIVAEGLGHATAVSSDHIAVVSDIPVNPGADGVSVENAGSDVWLSSVEFTDGPRWYQEIAGDPFYDLKTGGHLPLTYSASEEWVDLYSNSVVIDGSERVVTIQTTYSTGLGGFEAKTFAPAGGEQSSQAFPGMGFAGIVDDDILLLRGEPTDGLPGGPLSGVSLTQGSHLWTLDLSSTQVFDTPGSATLIGTDWPTDMSQPESIYGILPAASSGPTYETVAAPSEIPECPGDTILLAWAQLDNGWVLVCGITADQPTVFIVGGEASGNASGTSSSQVKATEVTFNADAGRYSATLEDGRRAWLDHTPSVLGIKDPAGATTTQTSVIRIFFVTLGESGEAQGLGAYQVQAPEHTAEDQVRYFSEILASSAAARSTLGPAVGSVRDCTSVSGYVDEINTIAAVRDNRAELLLAIGAAPVDLVPEGTALVNELAAALTASYNADVAYLEWAQAVQTSGCGSGSEAGGVEYSRQAGLAKDAFSARWNSVIAPAFGVATVARESL